MSKSRACAWALGLCGVMLLGACGENEGAPKVPHAIVSNLDDSCRSCHRTGVNSAPISPHPDRSNCLGCHGN